MLILKSYLKKIQPFENGFKTIPNPPEILESPVSFTTLAITENKPLLSTFSSDPQTTKKFIKRNLQIELKDSTNELPQISDTEFYNLFINKTLAQLPINSYIQFIKYGEVYCSPYLNINPLSRLFYINLAEDTENPTTKVLEANTLNSPFTINYLEGKITSALTNVLIFGVIFSSPLELISTVVSKANEDAVVFGGYAKEAYINKDTSYILEKKEGSEHILTIFKDCLMHSEGPISCNGELLNDSFTLLNAGTYYLEYYNFLEPFSTDIEHNYENIFQNTLENITNYSLVSFKKYSKPLENTSLITLYFLNNLNYISNIAEFRLNVSEVGV